MSNNKKPVLVIFTPDCFSDTEDTVIKHLTEAYDVVWFYLYESLKADTMRYSPESLREYADKNGVRLEIIDPKMRRRNPCNILYFKKVAEKIDSYLPDIVFSCDIMPFWALSFRYLKCPIKIMGVHDVVMHSYKFSISKFIIEFVKSALIQHFDYLITFSKSQQGALLEKYGKRSFMVGRSYKTFGFSSKTPPPIDSQVRLLFFGGISQYKGLDLLINALEELRRENVKNLFLTIAGTGESWEDYAPLLKSSEMYDLKIRFIRNDEIPDLMSSHHFLVLPYRTATQSGPLVIALGYGLPVIAPCYGCFIEIYNDNAALLFEPGRLKAALKAAASISQSSYELKRQSVLKLRESYSEERIAGNYLKAFDSILKERGTF